MADTDDITATGIAVPRKAAKEGELTREFKALKSKARLIVTLVTSLGGAGGLTAWGFDYVKGLQEQVERAERREKRTLERRVERLETGFGVLFDNVLIIGAKVKAEGLKKRPAPPPATDAPELDVDTADTEDER